jgi:excisionase family DNA binding protein
VKTDRRRPEERWLVDHDAKLAIVDGGTMSVKDAVKFTGFGRMTIRRAIADGALAAVWYGRRVVIPRTELLRFLADRLDLRSG